MYHEQHAKGEVDPYSRIALLAICRSVFVADKWIDKHLCCLFERHAVLLKIPSRFGGIQYTPTSRLGVSRCGGDRPSLVELVADLCTTCGGAYFAIIVNFLLPILCPPRLAVTSTFQVPAISSCPLPA